MRPPPARDHGQLIFLDLRDRYGIIQVVVDDAGSVSVKRRPGAVGRAG